MKFLSTPNFHESRALPVRRRHDIPRTVKASLCPSAHYPTAVLASVKRYFKLNLLIVIEAVNNFYIGVLSHNSDTILFIISYSYKFVNLYCNTVFSLDNHVTQQWYFFGFSFNFFKN